MRNKMSSSGQTSTRSHTMSHTIIAFPNSELATIEDDTFIFTTEDPVYTVSSLTSYDFKTAKLNQVKWPFGDIDLPRHYNVISARKRTDELASYSRWDKPSERKNLPKYSNLHLYPELDAFLKSPTDTFNYISYGDKDGDYQLDVWHDQAYVVRSGNEVTATHIDTSYGLQEGDSYTFVWSFDGNFAVYNEGDVYSVVLISNNHL